jgi:hypothetical protein
MAPGDGGLREVFNRVPDGGKRGGTGCELLRPYLELDALRATVDPFSSVVAGNSVFTGPVDFFFFFFFSLTRRYAYGLDWALWSEIDPRRSSALDSASVTVGCCGWIWLRFALVSRFLRALATDTGGWAPNQKEGKVGLATEAESSDCQAACIVEGDRLWAGKQVVSSREITVDGLKRVDARTDEDEDEDETRTRTRTKRCDETAEGSRPARCAA